MLTWLLALKKSTYTVNAMSEEDLNRDVNGINTFAVVNFEDVIGEPENVESLPCNWKGIRNAFRGTLNCCYTFLSTILGIPVAILWGVSVACLTFYTVWCGTPIFKAFNVMWTGVMKIYATVVRGLLDPLFESCSILVRNIHIQRS